MPILVKLPNGETGQFPDGMADAEIERVLASQFGAPKQPKQPKPLTWGDAAKQGLSNIPSSAGRFAGDMYDAVTSPVQTVKALGNTALGYGQLLTGSDGEEKKLAQGMNAYFADRYGSQEGFKKALAQDPVGVLADMSTVFTGVGGVAKGGATLAAKAGMAGRAVDIAGAVGRGASAIGAATDPVALAGKLSPIVTKPAGMVKGWLLAGQPLEEKLMTSALKPSTTLAPDVRQGIVRTALEEKILPNNAGYEKLQGLLGEQRKLIGSMIGDESPTVLNVNDALEAARQSNWGGIHSNTVAPSAAQRAAERVFKDFADTYGDTITLEKAQEIKTKTNAALNEKQKYGVLAGPGDEAQKALVKAVKEKIEKAVPDISEENATLGAFMALDNNQIERAIARSQNNNMFGLTAGQMASAKFGAAGSAAGGILAGIPGVIVGGLLGKAVSEPANAARAALAVQAMKSASGKFGGLLDKLPDAMNRRNLTYPAYIDRMREE
jgi:hypothetical protein